MSSQNSKHNGKKYPCFYCLRLLSNAQALENHTKYCSEQTCQAISMPTDGDNNIMKFKNLHKTLPIPYVIFLDLEAYINPTSKQHIISKIAYHIVDYYENYKFVPRGFTPDDIKIFWKLLKKMLKI